MPSQDGLPAKFRKGLRRSVPSPLPPEQVDWAFPLAEIDINSKIYEKPPLWVYGKTAGDLETRRAVELMDSVRNKKKNPAVGVCPAGGKIRYLQPGDHREMGDDRDR
jgi:hypothetical protein